MKRAREFVAIINKTFLKILFSFPSDYLANTCDMDVKKITEK